VKTYAMLKQILRNIKKQPQNTKIYVIILCGNFFSIDIRGPTLT